MAHVPFHGFPQSDLQVDGGGVPKVALRRRDVRPRMLNVSRPRRAEFRAEGFSQEAADFPEQVDDGKRAAAGDVVDLARDPLRGGRSQVRIDDVCNVRKVARLRAVTEDRRAAALQERRDKKWNDG